MANKRKIKYTVLLCVMADPVILTLIILVFGTYKNKKADDTPAAETVAAADDTAEGGNGSAANGSADTATGAGAANDGGTGSAAGTTAAAENAAGELTKEDVKRLLEEGTKMYSGWVVGFVPTLDQDDYYSVGNDKYYRVTAGEYKTVDEIKAALHNCYTNACFEEFHIDTLYQMKDGALYGYWLLGQGGDMSPEHVDVKILSQTENECSIRVVYDSVYANDWETTIVKEDGKWKFRKPIDVFNGYPYFTETVPWVD